MEEVIFVDNELRHYGVKGMKWGVRKNPKLPKEAVKRYKKYTKTLTPEQRKQNDSQVETWRINAKKRKNKTSRFDWGPLGKDLSSEKSEIASFKIYDYYSRNGKSFYEDRKDLYLNQWISSLERSFVNYETLGKKFVERL